MNGKRSFILLGAVNGFLAVAFGAFGAHGLKDQLTDALYTVFQTGSQYHVIHALGLMLIGILCESLPSRCTRLAGWAMLAGILLFSGSLYALAITGIRPLGIITPFGGLAFLLGWGCLAIGAWRLR